MVFGFALDHHTNQRLHDMIIYGEPFISFRLCVQPVHRYDRGNPLKPRQSASNISGLFPWRYKNVH